MGDFSLLSAQAANAEANDWQGYTAERRSVEKSWKARLRFLRLLTLLSAFQLQPQRLSRRTLLRCLETIKYCATQKLGRSFLTPLMNSSDTWTSREVSPEAWSATKTRCSRVKVPLLTPLGSAMTSLRLEQKTSGLFDTEGASVNKLAGLTKIGLEFGDMDAFPNMAPGDSLGGLFQELPIEMTEADYLDSFVDLSNFLLTPEVDRLQEMERENVCVGDTAPDAEMKEDLGFSGIISQLAAEADNADTSIGQIASEIWGNPTTCRPADIEVFSTDTVNVVEVVMKSEATTSDHDYVSKKPRLGPATAIVEPSRPASPYSGKGAGKSTKRYRERRDKNNVASQRSRQIRKEKFVLMDVEADRLEVRNAELRVKIEELEKLAQVMKAQLIQKMTEK